MNRHRHRPLGASWVLVCAAGLVALGAFTATAQNLQELDLLRLPGVWAGQAAWADYDQDGDADLLLIGETLEADGRCRRIARILRNVNGALDEDVTQTGRLLGVYFGDAGWADYDGDGDVDLAVAGWGDDGDESLVLYRNDPGAEAGSRQLTADTDQVDDSGGAVLVGVRYADLAWADLDRDGDLDLVVTGMTAGGVSSTRVYRNQAGRLRLDELNSDALLNVHNGELAWADYDNDGDLDLALAGENVHAEGGIRRVTEFYLNEPTGILGLDQGLTGVATLNGGSLAWGDYDGDGNVDLAQSGRTETWSAVTQLFHNRPAGTLTADPAFALNAFLQIDGALAWVDYDNDGDLDLAASGRTILSDRRAFVFENRNGVVSAVSAEATVEGLAGGATVWGDYDGDGRADLLLTGIDGDGVRRTILYTNSVSVHNRPPSPPAALNRVTVTSRRVLFSWSASSDDESPVLSYNLRLGSEPGAGDILSAAVPLGPGNAGTKTSFSLDRSLAPNPSYYWSVQAVDGGLARSDFAAEGQFVVGTFVSSDQSLRGMTNAAMAWSDADGDGDVDLALMGTNRSGVAQTLAYVNRNGLLTLDASAGLTGLTGGDLAWGDYDGDGDLDLFATGRVTEDNRLATLYRVRLAVSDSLIFDPVLRFGPALDAASVAWGDLDLDGDLDLVTAGQSDSVADGVQRSFTQVWVNDGDGGFAGRDDGLEGLNNGDLALGDVDGDGDLDLLQSGVSSTGERRTDLLRNDLEEGLTLTDAGLVGLESSALALGDYDRDGDLDLVAAGLTAEASVRTLLYDNDGGGLVERPDVNLLPVRTGDVVWADYDNDQDLDLILSGNTGAGPVLEVWENTIGQAAPDSAFERKPIAILAGVDFSAVAMADADGDGDLDLVSAGRSPALTPSAAVNDNLTAQLPDANVPPAAPAGLVAADSADVVDFAWQPGSDDGAPPAASLTYQLRVGTAPGAHDVVSGARDLAAGNAGHTLGHRVTGLASGTYFWSVRTVDAGYAASAEAPERTFVVDTVPPRVIGVTFNRSAFGLGQTVSLALELDDAHAGVDPRRTPRVTAVIGGDTLAFTTLQFTGTAWSGELTVDAATPSGRATLSVRGAADLKGNELVPFDSLAAFAVDAERPTVVRRQPAADALDVAPGDAAVVIGFSEPLDPATVSGQAATLSIGGEAVPVEVTYDAADTSVAIVPAAGLLPGTQYLVSTAATLADAAGNAAGQAQSWTFRTRVPQLVSTTPADGSADVAGADPRLEAVFDGALMPQALTDAVQVLREGVAEALREPPVLQDDTLRFEPAAGLRPGSRYEVVLSGRLGGPLRAASDAGDYGFSFSTVVPVLTATAPAAGDTAVSVEAVDLVATFDHPVDGQALAAADAVRLRAQGVPVDLRQAPVFDAVAGQVHVAPAGGLRPGTGYQVILSSLLGGPRRAGGGDYAWTFATAVPRVVSLIPAAGDTAVSVDQGELVIAFDQPIAADLLDQAGSAQLFAGGTPVTLDKPVYASTERTLTLRPSTGLRAGTAYRAQLAADLRGPRAEGGVSWTFATLVPHVAATDPASGQAVPAGSRRLTVRFSSAVDAERIQPRNFRLARAGNPVPLAAEDFRYDPATHTVSLPAVELVSGSRYTLVVSARIGGPRATGSDHEVAFTTTVPSIVAADPPPGAQGVSLTRPTLLVGFSGPVARRDGSGFRLQARSLDELPAAGDEGFETVEIADFTADSSFSTVRFSPGGGLRPFTEYRVTVEAPVLGSLAVADSTWAFSTAAVLADAARGGTVTSADRRLRLYLPPNALAAAAEIRIAPVDEEGAGRRAARPAGVAQGPSPVGPAWQIDAGQTPLRKPASLQLAYGQDLGAADPARLAIFRLEEGSWDRVGGTPDPAAGTVATTIDAFGTYRLFEDLTTGVGSVAVRGLDCQPRAFAPAGGDLRARTDISFELTAPHDVTVRIYNAAGRLERVVARNRPLAPGRNSLVWDGRDDDARVVASGLYVVVVSAGGAQAEKVVAVVR